MSFTLSEVLRGCYPPITFRDLFNSLYYTEAETPITYSCQIQNVSDFRVFARIFQRKGHTESNEGYLPGLACKYPRSFLLKVTFFRIGEQ